MNVTVREDILQRAALELLTSSGVRRYVARARALAREAFPLDHDRDAATQRALVARLVELVRVQSASGERGVEEFEAALILAALLDHDVDEGDAILTELAGVTHLGLRWLSGMARELLRERAATAPLNHGAWRTSPMRAATTTVDHSAPRTLSTRVTRARRFAA
jgi:hypothetical protein